MGHMKAPKKISEAEIEQQLIADAEDPDAWEAPITVPATHAPRPKWYGRTYKQPSVKSEAMRKSIAKRKAIADRRPNSNKL
jgi:hypothetical protein